MKPALKKILISRPDRLGDVVISSTCLRSIQGALPDAQVFYMTRPAFQPLFAELPEPFAFLPLAEESSVEMLAEQFKSLHAEAIVHLNPDPIIEEAAYQAGIGLRIGYGRSGDPTLTHVLPNHKKRGDKLEALYNFDLLAFLGVAIPEKLEPFLAPDSAGRESLSNRSGHPDFAGEYAVMHLAAFGDKPRVPAGCFAKLSRYLIRNRSMKVCVVGNQQGDRSVEEFFELMVPDTESVYDLVGKTSLAELAWLFNGAALAVSRDSGPAHLAAAVGCPTVTIMAEPNRVKSSRRWFPLGPRSRVIENEISQGFWENDEAFARRNLSMLDWQHVIDVAKELMDESTA